MTNFLKHLSKREKEDIFDALNYLQMSEIKEFCHKHSISVSGKKGEILDRVKHFLTTGKIISPSSLPEISKAKRENSYPLLPKTRILKGSYKNDLSTRQFLKKLVGDYFHFTSFGQDWILNRWREGKPPTYAEFAKFWQKEYMIRKKSEANPKKEWAYLNFIKQFQKKNPQALKKDISKAWEKTRTEKAKQVMNLLNRVLK